MAWNMSTSWSTFIFSQIQFTAVYSPLPIKPLLKSKLLYEALMKMCSFVCEPENIETLQFIHVSFITHWIKLTGSVQSWIHPRFSVAIFLLALSSWLILLSMKVLSLVYPTCGTGIGWQCEVFPLAYWVLVTETEINGYLVISVPSIKAKQLLSLYRVATYESVKNSLAFPWPTTILPDNLFAVVFFKNKTKAL